MDEVGARVVAAARECVGARFRAQGRDPGTGLDCVGLAAWAYRAAGAQLVLRAGYASRGRREREAIDAIERNGFKRVERAAAGDLMLLRAGAAQAHLAVWCGTGFVHADARLRRVVETPGAPGWPVVGVWRWISDAHAGRAEVSGDGFPLSRE